MANYSITINSKFRPFSFQELMTPLMMMEQNHREVEEQYANLMTESAKWENLANEQTDKIAYNQYKRYALDLELAADKLAKEGITANSRPSMYKLKSRYNSEIAPIEAAYNLRAADIKAQNDFEAATGGQAIFTKRASTASLDDYLNGKPMDYGRTNLDAVQKEGMLGGAAISKRYIRTTEGKLFQNDYYNLKTTTGLSEEEILSILNKSGKYPNFEKFINDTLTKHGYSNYSDIDKLKMESALLTGINMGITYEEKNTPMENWRAKSDYEFNQKIREKLFEYQLNNPDPTGGLGIQHLDAPIDENVESYDDVRSMYTSRGGLKAGFFTKNSSTEAKDWVNPLAIKDTYNKIYKQELAAWKKRGYEDKPNTRVMGSGPNARLVDAGGKSLSEVAKTATLERMRNLYGNINIISDSQYNKLKRLGYTSKSKRADFENSSLDEKINNRVLLYSPTSVNLTKYDFAQDRLSSRIPDYERMGNKSSVYEYKNGKVTSKSADLGDYLKDGKFNATVKDIAYSIQNPDYILYITDKGTIAMKAEGDVQRDITETVKSGLSAIDKAYKNGEITFNEMAQRKSNLQDDAAGALQLYENSRVPVKGDTSAPLWGTGEGDNNKK